MRAGLISFIAGFFTFMFGLFTSIIALIRGNNMWLFFLLISCLILVISIKYLWEYQSEI